MHKEASHMIHIVMEVIAFAAFTVVMSVLFFMCRQAISTKTYNDGVASIVVEAGEYYKYFGDNRDITVQNMIGFISLYGDKYKYIIEIDGKYYSTEDKSNVETAIGKTVETAKYEQLSYDLKKINHEIYINSNLDSNDKMKATLYTEDVNNIVKVSSDGADSGTLVYFKLE